MEKIPEDKKEILIQSKEISYPKFVQLPDIFLSSLPQQLEILNSYKSLTGYDKFCGTEVIDYNSELLNISYWITFKSVGIRLQLYIYNNNSYLVQCKEYGDLIFTPINLNFPTKNLKQIHNNTLLECILVSETISNKTTYRLLIFDILYLDGQDVYNEQMQNRINLITSEIIDPRNKNKEDLNNTNIKVRFKDCFSLRKIEFLLHTVLKQVTHKTDGIIFLPSGPGSLRNKNAIKPMKWNNTIDSEDILIGKIKNICKMNNIKI